MEKKEQRKYGREERKTVKKELQNHRTVFPPNLRYIKYFLYDIYYLPKLW